MYWLPGSRPQEDGQLKKNPSEIIAPKYHKTLAARNPVQQASATATCTVRRTRNGEAAANQIANKIAVHRQAAGDSPAPGFATGPTSGPPRTAALMRDI